MSEEIIFECQDQMYPDYKLLVTRINGHTGHLVVTQGPVVLHKEDVPLAYGAIFGPDVMDIDSWGQIACQVVDHHREKHA